MSLVIPPFLCALSLWLAVSAVATGQVQRPNILLVLADDVGQEVLGCYGGESYPTPHLDALAQSGMRFQHGYSMPVCHPTRLSLLTGKYPVSLGNVGWGDFPKAEEEHSLANVLKSAGYATAVVGKWQLCLMKDDLQQPRRLGFDQWDVFGWHEGPRYYEPMIYRNGRVREDTLGHYGPDLYVESLIEFMKANREKSFFAFYSMALCHDVTDDLERPVPHGPFGRYDSYAEMVAEMDRNVGRLVAALNALDLREKTLILFTSDNGTPQQMIIRAEGNQLIKEPVVSRRHGRDIPGGKKKLTDDGTRVPMIATWLGTIKPNQVVDDLVDCSDFLPTFAELAGAELSNQRRLNGQSFAKRLRNEGPAPRQWAYAQSNALPKPGGTAPDGKDTGQRWMRTAEWKLYSDGRLYHMQTDGEEKHPILKDADTEEQRAIRAFLSKALGEIL